MKLNQGAHELTLNSGNQEQPGFIHFNAGNGNVQFTHMPRELLSQIDVVLKVEQTGQHSTVCTVGCRI